MNLTPAEKETIILTSEADDTASVYTFDARLIRKLKQLHERFPDKIYPAEEVKHVAVSYIVPKNCIVIYPPHTDEWKAAARERAKITGFHPKMTDT